MSKAVREDIALRRKHLDDHRPMIVGRSLALGIVGAIPVPLVDDWLRETLLRNTYGKLATARHVEIGHEAMQKLIYGREEPPDLAKLLSNATLLRLAARAWAKLLVFLTVARRVRAVARNFTRITLFDHYCARMHTGIGIDPETGAALHETMARAIDETTGELGQRMLRRGISAALRVTLQAPAEVLDIATAGTLRRLLERRRQDGDGTMEFAAAHEVDAVIERELASESSFLGRATRAIDLQLSVQGNPYLDAAIENFERMWRTRQTRSPR